MNTPTLLPEWLDECALTSPDVAKIAEDYIGSNRSDWARTRLFDDLRNIRHNDLAARLVAMTDAALLTACLHAAARPSLVMVICPSPSCLGAGNDNHCHLCHGKGVVKPSVEQVVRADQIATQTAEAKLFGVAA